MSVEQKQVKNLRNRILTFIKQAPPEALVKFALFLNVKIPNELIEKYAKKDEGVQE